MAKERVVIVGAGGISKAWIPPLQKEKIEIVALVDLNLDTARQRAAEYKLDIEISDDLPKTLRSTQPDFVLDLTIPEAHAKVTCAALKMGIPVLGEKPMASTLPEARRMVRTAEQNKTLYAVSQSRRWIPNHDVTRRMLQKGRVGTVTTANCDFYIGAHFGGFRAVMDSPLILDMAIHHFDLARYLIGADPLKVYCHEFNPAGSWYTGDVAASAIFEMTNGVVFTYRGSWCAEGCLTSWNGNWRIIGTKGTLLMQKDEMPTGEVVVGKPKGGLMAKCKPVQPLKPTLKYETMHGALREMLAALRGGPTPQCECHDNIKSLAMVQAAIQSSKTGRAVTIDV
jgi:predicted dehydrogenase